MHVPETGPQGVVPIIPTLFNVDEEMDLTATAACVRFAVESELSAVCLPAYGSEFYKLTGSERAALVGAAVEAAAGRTLVIAQSNHPAARHAAEIAKANEGRGANLISFALPRMFALPEADLLAYSRTICQAVEIPVLIQDFNPSGQTIGAEFCRRLSDDCDNFSFVKLEEPLMAPKVRAIREATEDRVGVLEGWGGMYLLELIDPGICGLMPGLALGDLLQKVWRSAREDDRSEASNLFEKLLPQIVYSLQNMELFLWMEKDLLARRGVISRSQAHVRAATCTPDEDAWRHAIWLNQRVADLAAE